MINFYYEKKNFKLQAECTETESFTRARFTKQDETPAKKMPAAVR
jgi:hypothetical protein